MFDQSLLESTHAQARRPYSALASFGLQSGLVLLALAIPLFHPESISLLQPMAAPVLFRLPAITPSVHLTPAHGASTASTGFRYSPNFPNHPPIIRDAPGENVAPPDAFTCPPYCGTDPQGTALPIGTAPPPVTLEKPQPPPQARLHVSTLNPSSLVYRVQPAYPSIAIQTRTEGDVRLAAVIGRDGSIQQLQVLSGHPLLAAAALNAVRQWRYRPLLLNGEPVEVETTVVVHFTLSH